MPTPERESFASLQKTFFDELEANRFSKSLLDRVQRVLPELFFHLRENGVFEIQAVSERHLESFAAKLRKKTNRNGEPLSLATQQAYISVVKRLFAFLDQRSVILRNPARELRGPRAKHLPKVVLSETEVQKLLEAPPAQSSTGLRNRAILELLYGTAIRRGECVRLNVGDVDLHTTTLLVRDGKGNKDRFVPIPGKAAEAAHRYLEQARPFLVHDPAELAFFLGRTGNRVSASLIRNVLQASAKAAGIQNRAHVHALRRACATHLLQRGASVRHVQKLLGHASIDTTAIYTDVAVGDLKKALKRSHPRELPSRSSSELEQQPARRPR